MRGPTLLETGDGQDGAQRKAHCERPTYRNRAHALIIVQARVLEVRVLKNEPEETMSSPGEKIGEAFTARSRDD